MYTIEMKQKNTKKTTYTNIIIIKHILFPISFELFRYSKQT